MFDKCQFLKWVSVKVKHISINQIGFVTSQSYETYYNLHNNFLLKIHKSYVNNLLKMDHFPHLLEIKLFLVFSNFAKSDHKLYN